MMSNWYLFDFISLNIVITCCDSQAAGQVVSDDVKKLAENGIGR